MRTFLALITLVCLVGCNPSGEKSNTVGALTGLQEFEIVPFFSPYDDLNKEQLLKALVSSLEKIGNVKTREQSSDSSTYVLVSLASENSGSIQAFGDVYRNNLKNWFLTASALLRNFHPHSSLVLEQWSLAPDGNFEEPPCHKSNSSNHFGIEAKSNKFKTACAVWRADVSPENPLYPEVENGKVLFKKSSAPSGEKKSSTEVVEALIRKFAQEYNQDNSSNKRKPVFYLHAPIFQT
jgi:hypothetical protein